MNLLNLLSEIESISAIDFQNKKNILLNTKKEYRSTKIICLIGTIVVAAICLGIMFLRFRIFGR